MHILKEKIAFGLAFGNKKNIRVIRICSEPFDQPSKDWVRKWVKTHSFKLVNPSYLELSRGIAGERSNIEYWLENVFT